MERIRDTSVASSIAAFSALEYRAYYYIFIFFCFLEMTNKPTDYFIVAHFILLSHSIHIGVILG